jgi:hypothetical protein
MIVLNFLLPIQFQSDIGLYLSYNIPLSEEFEGTKGVIRIRKSKKNRQHNDHEKKYKRKNKNLQNIHIKLKIE